MAKARTTKANTTEKQPVKKVAIPEGLSKTFERKPELSGAFILNTGQWFFKEFIAERNKERFEATSIKFVKNPFNK